MGSEAKSDSYQHRQFKENGAYNYYMLGAISQVGLEPVKTVPETKSDMKALKLE